MAFSADQGRVRRGPAIADEADWIEPDAPPRDWKKAVLVIGLGILSWVATYVGMLELIESNMGDLPLLHKAIIGFSVGMLMIMIIWLLDQLFSPIGLTTKVIYAAGYLFLTLISVGFGFGFYWKVLESRSESTRSAESAISQVQTALHAGTTRLEQLNATLKQLADLSTAKAIQEREKGTTCPNSRPGDGPRRKLRDDDAQRFAFASQFVSGRIEALKSEVAALEGDLLKVVGDDTSTRNAVDGTRNEFLRALNRRLELTVTGFNAFRTDPQLRQIRVDLGERADRSVFPTGSGTATFSCPDAQLQAALGGVVKAIDQLPEMRKPQIAAVEGSEATIEAFRRLTATLMGAMVLDLPPSADELRDLQKRAVQSVSAGTPAAASAEPVGLSKRDYIPLAIALFVDLCLLLVSIGRPMNRLNTLIPIIREAERGPMGKILTRFSEIHRDPEVRQTFEVFRHVVFDMHGAYYVAVPLDAPYRPNARGQGGFGYGSQDAQDLQHEAHLLSNLFSSFEQEKIFSRVYNPFLSTKAIQRTLFRQGSKFAGCQAFRVYRFRDGQWSKVILNAVMAAAKRAEEDKRRQRRLEDEVETRVTRELAARVDAAVREATQGSPASSRKFATRARTEPLGIELPGLDLKSAFQATSPRGGADADDGESEDGEAAAAIRRPAMASARRRASSSGLASGRGQAHGTGSLDGHEAPAAVATASAGLLRSSQTGTRRRAEAGRAAGPAEVPALRSAFGRYADTAAAELGQPEGDSGDEGPNPLETKVANSNTAPAGITPRAPDPVPAEPAARATRREQDAVGLPTPRFSVINGAFSTAGTTDALAGPPEEPRATVTLTRETATFSVPVSEARLPGRLAADRLARQPIVLGQAALAAPAAEPIAVIDAVPSQIAVPPPLPGWAQARRQIAVDNGPQAIVVAEAAWPDVDGSLDDQPEPIDSCESDGEPDEATVTIAQRLKPSTGGES
ncbi:MAG: hypothetical protein NW217_02390 [Hyphomicrobiaceae bacterium]|nr:hypothetical protein [Hyphomicrobiaceae bacterium]